MSKRLIESDGLNLDVEKELDSDVMYFFFIFIQWVLYTVFAGMLVFSGFMISQVFSKPVIVHEDICSSEVNESLAWCDQFGCEACLDGCKYAETYWYGTGTLSRSSELYLKCSLGCHHGSSYMMHSGLNMWNDGVI